jgi:hypothetical protein
VVGLLPSESNPMYAHLVEIHFNVFFILDAYINFFNLAICGFANIFNLLRKFADFQFKLLTKKYQQQRINLIYVTQSP